MTKLFGLCSFSDHFKVHRSKLKDLKDNWSILNKFKYDYEQYGLRGPTCEGVSKSFRTESIMK
jgi:hypothetical protein